MTSRSTKVLELIKQADLHRERGDSRAAFRGYLPAAKLGDPESQFAVGYRYQVGEGIKQDLERALYWYRRASRKGSWCAANNAGVIWRDRNDTSRALHWFKKAALMGDGDANLEVARTYLANGDRRKAMPFLKRVLQSTNVTVGAQEEAVELLGQH